MSSNRAVSDQPGKWAPGEEILEVAGSQQATSVELDSSSPWNEVGSSDQTAPTKPDLFWAAAQMCLPTPAIPTLPFVPPPLQVQFPTLTRPPHALHLHLRSLNHQAVQAPPHSQTALPVPLFLRWGTHDFNFVSEPTLSTLKFRRASNVYIARVHVLIWLSGPKSIPITSAPSFPAPLRSQRHSTSLAQTPYGTATVAYPGQLIAPRSRAFCDHCHSFRTTNPRFAAHVWN